MSYEDLPCQQAVELVTDYLEVALNVEQLAALERHLAWCEWCATYVEQMRETVRLAGVLSEDDLAPQARDELLEVFRDWKSR